MKDVNIEIEQYEEKQMEKQRRENRRWVLFNRIALLYKRLLRKIYTYKIKFLDGYHGLRNSHLPAAGRWRVRSGLVDFRHPQSAARLSASTFAPLNPLHQAEKRAR